MMKLFTICVFCYFFDSKNWLVVELVFMGFFIFGNNGEGFYFRLLYLISDY
jgi:hypothetical protein